MLLGIPLLCFCTLRVYQLLSQHISIVSVRLNKTPEQIRDEKSVLKAIVIQALIPIICYLPAVFILIVVVLQGWYSPAANLTIFRYGENGENRFTMIILCDGIMVAFMILDPFITLLVVKSYRKAANQFLAKFKFYRILIGFEERVTVSVLSRIRERSTVAPS